MHVSVVISRAHVILSIVLSTLCFMMHSPSQRTSLCLFIPLPWLCGIHCSAVIPLQRCHILLCVFSVSLKLKLRLFTLLEGIKKVTITKKNQFVSIHAASYSAFTVRTVNGDSAQFIFTEPVCVLCQFLGHCSSHQTW